jgi:hypothetical protein
MPATLPGLPLGIQQPGDSIATRADSIYFDLHPKTNFGQKIHPASMGNI